MYCTTLFIWFMIYSVLGWIYETIYCSVRTLQWDNRGMLNGPYCPIYGVGAVLDVLVCGDFPNAGFVFFTCMFGSAILEYATSYMTEKLFHAVWWDYSDEPLNIHGRICLPFSLGFGIAGLIVLYGIHPYMERLTNPLPLNLQEFLALVLMAVFAADCALTADSLAAVNEKINAAVTAMDLQISGRYEAFIEGTKQRYSDGMDSLKGKISFEEFREIHIMEALKESVSSMNRAQFRAARSFVSFRHPNYSAINGKVRSALSARSKKRMDPTALSARGQKCQDLGVSFTHSENQTDSNASPTCSQRQTNSNASPTCGQTHTDSNASFTCSQENE